MNRNGSKGAAIDAGMTHFRVPVDAETMPILMEQAKAAGCPPPLLLAVIVRDALAFAKASGLTLALGTPVSGSKH